VWGVKPQFYHPKQQDEFQRKGREGGSEPGDEAEVETRAAKYTGWDLQQVLQSGGRQRMKRARIAHLTIIVLALFTFITAASAQEQDDSTPEASQQSPGAVTEISADLGSCSVEFKVTDMKGKPVYNAKIKTQVRYGFLSKRKLDLEAGTNADGRARFVNMPDQVKNPIVFEGTYGGDTATMTWDPGTNCRAQYPIVVGKKPEQEGGGGSR
jgi:hypothetical protein